MNVNICLIYQLLGGRGYCSVYISRDGKERHYRHPSQASKMRLASLLNRRGWEVAARSYGWEASPPRPEPEPEDDPDGPSDTWDFQQEDDR